MIKLMEEIKSRRLLQTLIVYLGGAWVAIEVCDVFIDRFELPKIVFDLVLIFVIAGIPGSLAIAWFHGKKGGQKITLKEILIQATIFLFAVVVAVFTVNGSDEPKIVAKNENSIAVLPFADMSEQKDQEYFCDGMTEQIITNLSQLQNLKVIARTSVMKFKDSDKTIPEIANELNVAHVLEGSIRKSGDQIRVTAQLVKAKDGYHLWAKDYDRELKDIFSVQDEVSEAIATVLLSKLSVEQVEDLRTKQTENVEAYEYYLKGRYFHDTRFWGATFRIEDFEKAKQMFERAIELDPDYALAHAGLADLLDTYLDRVAKNKNYDDLRWLHVERALELDPNCGYAHTVKGFVLQYRHEPESAYESFRRALEITPNDFDTNWAMGNFFFNMGIARQAVRFFSKAIENNPLGAMGYVTRGEAYLQAGNFESARADYETALEIEADHIDALSRMAGLYILQGDEDRAEELLIKCRQINPDYRALKIIDAYLLAAKGEKEQAVARHEDDIVYILLGKKDEAIHQLNKQHEQGWPLGITSDRLGSYLSLKNLFIYDSLRDDPRFVEILEKEKKRYDGYLRKYGTF